MKETNKELVEHIAHLARLKISSDEIPSYQKNLEKIFSSIEILNQLNTEKVEPLLSPSWDDNHFYEDGKSLREDKVRPSLSVEKILQNAPVSKLNQIEIERVLEEET